MKGREKDEAMERFQRGDAKILVATTVVEVGVDVPEATIMVIEHAERFGLAQFASAARARRAREGKSSCLMLLQASRSAKWPRHGSKSCVRRRTGSALPRKTCAARRRRVLGQRQSGTPGFRVARLETHGHLLEMARDDAVAIFAEGRELQGPRGEALRRASLRFR